MSYRWLLTIVLLSLAEPAWGQKPSVQQRPTVSPFINLGRPGANPGIEYYGVIRPEINLRNSINQLQGHSAIQQNAAAGEFTTGHDIHFRNYSHFFPGFGGQPAGGFNACLSLFCGY